MVYSVEEEFHCLSLHLVRRTDAVFCLLPAAMDVQDSVEWVLLLGKIACVFCT